jgi:hypothetical protein
VKLLSEKLKQIYISFVRTFRFRQKNSKFRSNLDFLKRGKEEDYFKEVVSDINYLWNEDIEIAKKGKTRPLGRLRSVLKYIASDHTIKADPFFHKLQEFYISLYQENENLILVPHYPCAIDILPSEDREYQVVSSTLPGSLRDANPNMTKMSLSMRIYPVGIASLRLGWFLSTEKSFKIEDIIDFLWNKETNIEIDKQTLDIDALSVKYAKILISGLIEKKPPPFRWLNTYSLIDIVKATVSYLSGKMRDRRTVRTWLRNFIELSDVQKYLISEIEAVKFYQMYCMLKQYWLNRLKKGILPPKMRPLFSLWVYTQLHQRTCTLEKESWRNRYQEFLKVLDKKGRIQEANDSAMITLEQIETETRKANSDAGKWLKYFIDFIGTKLKP